MIFRTVALGFAAAWVLAAGPASAAFLTVTQDTPGGLVTVFYNAEETADVAAMDIPLEVVGTTCAAGGNPAACEFGDLTQSRFGGGQELPGATGDWASSTRIEDLGGSAFGSNPTFSIFPGIETVAGDSFIIGQFSLAGLGAVDIIVSADSTYAVTDLGGLNIPLSQPRGTVLFSTGPGTGPSPAPALPPWMLGLLAVLLLGVTVGVLWRRASPDRTH